MMNSRILERLKRLARHGFGFGSLDVYSNEERRSMWPQTAKLLDKHIAHCKLVVDRVRLLECLPPKAVCAEVGVFHGGFSEKIVLVTSPREFHLIDLEEKFIREAKNRLADSVKAGIVTGHVGDSSTVLSKFDDRYFDWVYIDGDHSYEGVVKDLAVARMKVKQAGYIAMNDYTFFSPIGMEKYGVVEAVNEFCLSHDYEIVFLALQGRMYNDVVLRQIVR